MHSKRMAATERGAAQVPDPAAGFRVGHARHTGAPTGCTVILCPEGTVAGVDVRGILEMLSKTYRANRIVSEVRAAQL